MEKGAGRVGKVGRLALGLMVDFCNNCSSIRIIVKMFSISINLQRCLIKW